MKVEFRALAKDTEHHHLLAWKIQGKPDACLLAICPTSHIFIKHRREEANLVAMGTRMRYQLILLSATTSEQCSHDVILEFHESSRNPSAKVRVRQGAAMPEHAFGSSPAAG